MLELTEFALGVAAGAAIAIGIRALLERLRRAPSVGLGGDLNTTAADEEGTALGGPSLEEEGEVGAPSAPSRAPWAVTDPVPPPAVRASERVILHLYRAGAATDSHVLPASVTQAGMGKALGVTQSALTRTLGRLRGAGVLEVDRQFVVGHARRLKVYRLTPLGESLARNLDRKERGGGLGGG